MQFGVKAKDARQEGSGNYLRSFPKGETLVRFLEEPDDWNQYREHYTLDGKSFPCTEDKTTCPGCTHPNEKVNRNSRKFAAQVLVVKTEKVLPYKIPYSLRERLTTRAERNGGTLTNRDYVILKSGSGLETEYDVDQEDKYPVDLAELRKRITLDVQTCHQDSFKEVWGDWSADDADSSAKAARNGAGDPPSEPAAKHDAGAQGGTQDTVELTEAQVRAMSKPELRRLADTAGVQYTDDDTTRELADRLIESYGS